MAFLPPLKGLCHLFPSPTGRTEGPLLRSPSKWNAVQEAGKLERDLILPISGRTGTRDSCRRRTQAPHRALLPPALCALVASTPNFKIAGEREAIKPLHRTAFLFLLGKLLCSFILSYLHLLELKKWFHPQDRDLRRVLSSCTNQMQFSARPLGKTLNRSSSFKTLPPIGKIQMFL